MRFFVHEAISLAPTIVSPFPSADSALVCLASTEATHSVPGAFSNARFFCFFSLCVDDLPCWCVGFSSTKETGHWALIIQTAARFAVCHITMSLLSASLCATVYSFLTHFLEAFRAGKPLGRLRNSASAICRFKNVFHTQRVVRILWVGDYEKRAIGDGRGQSRRPSWCAGNEFRVLKQALKNSLPQHVEVRYSSTYVEEKKGTVQDPD